MIACRRCGRKPSHVDGKTHLVRKNRKGKPGIWECAPRTGCRAEFVDNPQTLADILQSLRALHYSVSHRPLPRGRSPRDVRL